MADTTDANKSATPYELEADNAKDIKKVASTMSQQPLAEGQEAGFFVANRNWFSRKKFGMYPQRGYKPVFLNDLSIGLWNDFNREVEFYQDYYVRRSWYYKIWTLVPTCWFLFMVLPDLLWYYEVIFRGVGVVCGLVLAAAFIVDTLLQRKLLRKKVQPMYAQLIEIYKPRFLLEGFRITYEYEPTPMDGMQSFIVFRKASGEVDEDMKKVSTVKETGFYLDEDWVGKMPYAQGMVSTSIPPRFLRGLDTGTWKLFAKAIEDRSATPRNYLLHYTIGMGLLVGTFVTGAVYMLVVLTKVRHWFLIGFFPLYELVMVMMSFRRRHYIENVLANDMHNLLKDFEKQFDAAGFGVSFELEYKFSYFFLNTYFAFWKKDSKYNATPGGSMT